MLEGNEKFEIFSKQMTLNIHYIWLCKFSCCCLGVFCNYWNNLSQKGHSVTIYRFQNNSPGNATLACYIVYLNTFC